MPAPYTDAEQDALIDQLLADMATAQADITQLQTDLAALDDRVTAIETTLGVLEPAFATAQADIAQLQTDSTTHGNNITTLQTRTSDVEGSVSTLQADVLDLQNRMGDIEGATLPAVDTLQDDVKVLAANSRNRQMNDQAALAKPRIVTRPAVERVRRPDGKLAQRTVQPR